MKLKNKEGATVLTGFKKPVKLTRKGLVRKLDKIFSIYIRMRDQKCVTCGSKERLQCGHLFTRNSYSTRWNEKNAFAQCATCNYRHEFDFYPFQSWYVNNFGQAEYDDLYRLHKTIMKFKEPDLINLIEFYQSEIDRLKGKLKENYQGLFTSFQN